MDSAIKCWESVTTCLTRGCEIVEEGFEKCVGKETSKFIGDFLLMSPFVTHTHKPEEIHDDYVAF